MKKIVPLILTVAFLLSACGSGNSQSNESGSESDNSDMSNSSVPEEVLPAYEFSENYSVEILGNAVTVTDKNTSQSKSIIVEEMIKDDGYSFNYLTVADSYFLGNDILMIYVVDDINPGANMIYLFYDLAADARITEVDGVYLSAISYSDYGFRFFGESNILFAKYTEETAADSVYISFEPYAEQSLICSYYDVNYGFNFENMIHASAGNEFAKYNGDTSLIGFYQPSVGNIMFIGSADASHIEEMDVQYFVNNYSYIGYPNPLTPLNGAPAIGITEGSGDNEQDEVSLENDSFVVKTLTAEEVEITDKASGEVFSFNINDYGTVFAGEVRRIGSIEFIGDSFALISAVDIESAESTAYRVLHQIYDLENRVAITEVEGISDMADMLNTNRVTEEFGGGYLIFYNSMIGGPLEGAPRNGYYIYSNGENLYGEEFAPETNIDLIYTNISDNKQYMAIFDVDNLTINIYHSEGGASSYVRSEAVDEAHKDKLSGEFYVTDTGEIGYN